MSGERSSGKLRTSEAQPADARPGSGFAERAISFTEALVLLRQRDGSKRTGPATDEEIEIINAYMAATGHVDESAGPDDENEVAARRGISVEALRRLRALL